MSKIRETLITNCEKKFLIKCLSEYRRIDGRAFDEFRELNICFGKDWGCCYVSLGKTKVLAQTSGEIQQPKSSRPSEGILNVNIELTSLAAPHFEPGRISDLSVQLNRLLEKCVINSKAVDLESLCIKANEKVWALRVDINVLNHEGSILDCASIAALTSLAHFRRLDVTCDGEEFIIHSYQQRDPIPTVIHHYPVCTTYAVFNEGEFILADPSLHEEQVAEAFLTIGLNSFRELCGLHLGGKTELMPDVILNTVNKATSRTSVIVEKIKDLVKKDTELREKGGQSGFHINSGTEKSVNIDMEIYLDHWQHRKKQIKERMPEVAAQNKEIEHDAKNIKLLGAGSVAYIPPEN